MNASPRDTVTVLIAAYNAAPFLHRAVASALNQTLPALEIVVVDDASTDATAETTRKLAANDPRVKLISLSENGGPSPARNAGLDAARGDWVAVLDADDAFLPDRLERMLAAAHETQADIVADNFAWYDAAADKIGDAGIPASDAVEIVSAHRFVAQARPFTGEADWGLLKPMFKRSFLTAHHLRYPTFSRHGEDFLFMLEILLAGGRYALLRRAGYLYTHRSSGFSRTRIDYDGMAAHTVALTAQPRVQADRKLSQALQARAKALRRLAAAYKLRPLIDRRDYAALLQLALTDPAATRELLRLGQRKALSWLR